MTIEKQKRKHNNYIDESVHHDFNPRPGSDIDPMIVYGTFLSSSFVVVVVCPADPLLFGISFGAVSSKISCTIRKLGTRKTIVLSTKNSFQYRISSPISMTRSCVSSSVSYCHAHVCSDSMKRDGC